jgi:ribosomal protein S6
MQKYDVVLLVDAKLSEVERKTLLADMEKSLGKAILEKDDMGVQSLAYNLSDKI